MILLCLSNTLAGSSEQTRYKLYCMFTPKFKTLLEEYFLPSLQDDFEVIINEYPQDCASGDFRSPGWARTMLYKLELLLKAIVENGSNQIFFYSDIDIIFLRPILEKSLSHLKDLDFVVQQGWPEEKLCAGFFVMRANERTLKLMMKAYHLLKEGLYADDQLAIQAALKEFQTEGIAWAFLPSEEYPNGKRVIKSPYGHYSAGAQVELDQSILLFHANCCIGLENKYHFLDCVKDLFNKNKGL